MVSNEHQRQISHEQLARLQQVRAECEGRHQPDPLVQAALLASVDTLIDDVKGEITEYKRLIAAESLGNSQ